MSARTLPIAHAHACVIASGLCASVCMCVCGRVRVRAARKLISDRSHTECHRGATEAPTRGNDN